MEDFTQQAQEWTQFFSAVAQVSGGLVGLVFIALTFNGKLADNSNVALGQLARQTFADFLNVLVVSLMLLVPHMPAPNVGLFVMIFGAFGVLRILRAILGMFRRRGEPASGHKLLQRFLLSLLGNVGLLVAGGTLLTGGQLGVFWSSLFGSIIGLLLSGARSAWTMVIAEPDNAAR